MFKDTIRFACALCAILAPVVLSTPSRAILKISSKPSQNITCAAGTCSPTAKKAVLNVSELAGMLVSGDVTVESGSVAQDIEIDAAISWTSASRFTLDSNRSIAFNRPVSVAGPGALTITTNDGGNGGDFQFQENAHVHFWNETSSLVINGNRYALFKTIRKQIRHVGCFVALVGPVNLRGKIHSTPVVDEFNGVFEGLGNTVSNLTIHDDNSSTTNSFIGLFGSVSGSGCPDPIGTIRDLHLESVEIVGNGTEQHLGTLAGAAMIENSSAAGTISANGIRTTVGGLVASGVVLNSHASVAISGTARYAGGLVGLAGGVDQSYATGSLTLGDGATVGGLVGNNHGSQISDSYATGAVSAGKNAVVGGLVGAQTNDDTPNPVIQTSYSTSALSAGQGSTMGGLIGSDIAASSLANNYWDLDTSGIGNPHQGAGNIPDDPGITGLTDAQLKSGLPAGFSGSLWKQKPNINHGYPYLANNPPG